MSEMNESLINDNSLEIPTGENNFKNNNNSSNGSTGSNNNSGTNPNDAASQTSLQRQSSLLQRIQAQRQREASQPQQIQVPQYNPAPTNPDLFANGTGRFGPPDTSSPDYGQGSSGSMGHYFVEAWQSWTHPVGHNGNANNDAAMSRSYEEMGFDSTEGLLSGSRMSQQQQPYSMSGYFMTGVRDVYDLFLRLPGVARAIVIVFLLYMAMKLL
jgi:hypothetical protein